MNKNKLKIIKIITKYKNIKKILAMIKINKISKFQIRKMIKTVIKVLTQVKIAKRKKEITQAN
jgi:hypothetical protein